MNKTKDLIDVTENFMVSENGFKRFSKIRINLFGNLGKRGEFIWEWVLKAAEITTLLGKDEEIEKESVLISNAIKMWGVAWDVLVDDIADEFHLDDSKRILPLLLNRESDLSLLAENEREYVEYAHTILESIFDACKKLPGYEIHKRDLVNGYKNLDRCMNYSVEIRSDVSKIELRKYKEILSHNMHMVINGVIDLMRMNHPTPIEKDKNLHKSFLLAQRMGRVGNATTTFKRELEVGDYSSEVLAVMIKDKLITPQQLEDNRSELLEIDYSGAVKKLWDEWEENKKKLENLIPRFPNLKMVDYIKGLVLLKQIHIQSEGSK